MPVTLGAVTAGIGAIQGVAGYFGAKKARKQLEGLQSPTYTPSKSISDYYNQSLSRYQQSPYQSNMYKMQNQNIARGTTQGISALQGRGSALSGISGLIQGQNDAQLKALATAEQDQNQKFSQLGSASQAMAGEERQAWNVNQLMPYERRYNMLAMKAQANNQLMNAGLQNISGGAQTALMGKSSGGISGGMGGGMGQGGAGDYDNGRYLPPSSYKVPLAKY